MKRIKRIRSIKKRNQADQPVWLFDLDNTLHHASLHIFPLIDQRMTQFIQENCFLDYAKADQLRQTYTKQYGAALVGLMRHHQINAADFLKMVHEFPDIAELIAGERSIRRIIIKLPGRKYVLTNGSEEYARGILSCLKLEALFDEIITIEQMRHRQNWCAKPHPAVMRKLIRMLRVMPKKIRLVEDTYTHLRAYKKFNIQTIWMTGFLNQTARRIRRMHYIDHRINSLKKLSRI